MSRKYIIAPTYSIGNYWADQLEIPVYERRFITSDQQLRRMNGKQSQWVLVEGEVFDNPELAINKTDYYKYLVLLDEYERYIYPRLEKDV